MKPALIVHGGAWDIPDEAVDACKSGCHRALTAGWSILSRGGSALDAIEAAIMVLEDDPVFDAGYGSHLNLDGHVEYDARRGRRGSFREKTGHQALQAGGTGQRSRAGSLDEMQVRQARRRTSSW